jgi:hypothetical protein
MASKLVIRRGIVLSVYDDRLLPLYEAIGVRTITRASEVEFNHDTRLWEAISEGRVIASGAVRSEVIKREIEYLEGGL